MLIKLDNNKKANIKHFLSDYTIDEVKGFFRDKYSCLNCLFCYYYKGKLSRRPAGDIFRCFCFLKYAHKSELNAILFSAFNKQKINEFAQRIEAEDDRYPDIVRIHPDNKELFILSGILVKSLDVCPVDRHIRGEEFLSPEYKNMMDKWVKKFGRKWSRNDVIKQREEMWRAWKANK